ncbi:hypothetical protein SLEP1_g22079 [Rubroshorea leprosula]|uniref:Uncharacterized protein n=1 Tax=Rubroshorea leprosula TaxID=152421 RepID=A0AAV5J820_9ROSI|nr:hypothetical protein SLEP1_g22079 [Rubroshorea leprosula]
MHLKKSEEQVINKIGEESSTRDCFSSDFRPTPLPSYPLHQIQTPGRNRNYPQSSTSQGFAFSLPNKPSHLTIQIPPNPPSIPTLNQHEAFFNSPSFALLSTPHKRSVMTQTLAKSPTLSSLKNHAHLGRKDSTFSQPFSCSGCFSIPFDAQQVADTLIRHLSGARLICFQLRFLFLFSLGSIYFLVSNPGRFFFLNFLFLLAFSLTLLISLNIGLPRLASIRLLLAHSLPSKFSSFGSSSKSSRSVVWSIGSKPKSERKTGSGSWVQAYSNGNVYEGEFHKGKYSGSGVYYYYMKGRYEGDWIDGKYDGYGVETWAKGSRYRGQYRQGLRHGLGVYRFYTGDVYAGEWSNGQCHGCGVHSCEDGSRYVGEVKWGVKHGLGHYHFRNGDTYAGEYFADKMHGYGVYQFGNGHRYEGAWHEGRRQGLGMYTRNGETQCGHWQNGFIDLPSSQNTHTGSVTSVRHSKVLDAVQEAQRAAEKAFEVAKIDERVNKAVGAANKAANAARVAAVKAVQEQMHQNNSDILPTAIV